MDKKITYGIYEYLTSFMGEIDFPQEAQEALLIDLKKVIECDVSREMFFAPIERYEKGEIDHLRPYIFKEKNSPLKRVKELTGIHEHTLDLLFFLCATPALEKRYEKKGLPRELFVDAMRDLKCKLIECKKVYDVWGSFVAFWFDGWFDMTRFALGRLQFEIKKMFTFFVCGGRLIYPGKRYLNLHIPSSGALNHDEVIASYKRAYEFFAPQFEEKDILFVTMSWLLFKEHRKMLPVTSNVIKFMDDFKIVLNFKDPKNGDFWRIFNKNYDKKLTDYGAQTTLQKAYEKHIKSGKKMGGAIGAFTYDGESFKK